MDLDALNRKVISLENRKHVNYSSIAGTAYQISFNGTTLTIESDGTFKANTVIVADNLSADNEERLQAVEEFCDNLETYITDHTHEISDVNGLQDALDAACSCNSSSTDTDNQEKEDDILSKIEKEINDLLGKKDNDLLGKEINDLLGCFSSYKMSEIITAYINTLTETKADKSHTHTKSDITDLTFTKSDISDLAISDDILSSSTCSLTEGTNYFTISLENTTIEGVAVYLFKFTKTDDFSSDKFSSFNLLIIDKSNTIINLDMGYSDGKFTFTSGGTGIIDGIITSDSFYCGKLKDDLAVSSFTITLTDSSANVLCKYTLEPVYVDSSNLLTFGAIDDTYVRKTFLEEHTHEISDVTNLQSTLNSKSDSSHTHSGTYLTKSELIDLFYPVGSIYTSMNSTSPANIFGGTWTQITNKFLYCANSSKTTGGSSTITEANLPAHTHTFTGSQSTDSVQFRNTINGNVIELYGKKGIYSLTGDSGSSIYYGITTEASQNTWDVLTWTYTPSGTLSSTGSGEEFLPPYITCFAWYRSA